MPGGKQSCTKRIISAVTVHSGTLSGTFCARLRNSHMGRAVRGDRGRRAPILRPALRTTGAFAGLPFQTESQDSPSMGSVSEPHHRQVTVDGVEIHTVEAGPADGTRTFLFL